MRGGSCVSTFARQMVDTDKGARSQTRGVDGCTIARPVCRSCASVRTGIKGDWAAWQSLSELSESVRSHCELCRSAVSIGRGGESNPVLRRHGAASGVLLCECRHVSRVGTSSGWPTNRKHRWKAPFPHSGRSIFSLTHVAPLADSESSGEYLVELCVVHEEAGPLKQPSNDSEVTALGRSRSLR